MDNGVPLTVYLVPAIGLGMGAFWLLLGRRLMTGADQRHRDFRVADLAQRLGLQIVEGDPTLNMMQAHTKHNMRMAKDKAPGILRSAKETKVVLEGAPYGRPTRFLFHRYTEVAQRIVAQVVSGSFDCRLSLWVPADLPPFEIVSRAGFADRYMGIRAKAEWDLPAQPFGDSDLDAKLALSSPDPRLGRHLAPVVGALVGDKYVHIQGNRGVIESLASKDDTASNDAGYFQWIFEVQHHQRVLEQMAEVLAGPVRR
jgi:hypothetical protein